jgi:hypothetical protein
MIGYKEIAQTTSKLDEYAKGKSLDVISRERGIDAEDLYRAARQRALRIGMLMAGQNPDELPKDRMSHVTLPPEIEQNLHWLATAFVDGFIAGRDVFDPAEGIRRFPDRRSA